MTAWGSAVSGGTTFISAGLQVNQASPDDVKASFADVAPSQPGGGWLWNYEGFAEGSSATEYATAVLNGLAAG